MNQYIAIDSGGYLFTNNLGAFMATWLDAEKCRWCKFEQVCQGVKCKECNDLLYNTSISFNFAETCKNYDISECLKNVYMLCVLFSAKYYSK